MLHIHPLHDGGTNLPKRTQAHSLAGNAAEQIRRKIVDGTLELGQALSENALAAELGVSKTPIREALQRLETEGLVQILPQRGTFVFPLSGIDAAPINSAIIPDRKLTTVHFTAPATMPPSGSGPISRTEPWPVLT